MSKYSLSTLAAAICIVTVIIASPARATVMEADSNSNDPGRNGNQTAFDSLILNNDLINTGQPSLSSSSSQDMGTVLGYGGFVDSHDGSTSPILLTPGAGGGLEWVAAGTTFTYQLNLNPGTGGSSTGYDITGVHFINGWSTPFSFADQKWDLQIATLVHPAFQTVWSVNYQPSAYQATMVSLTDSTGTIATGVTGIQFVTSTPVSFVLREIDVLGNATPGVPEPASLGLLSMGGLLLMRRGRSH